MLEAKTIQKYNDKKLPWLLKTAEQRINKFVRLRDSDGSYFKCISCSKFKPMNQCTAGHFLSVGEFSAVRFNLDNIFAQCQECNCFKNGNGKEYVVNLKKRIGVERYENLLQGARKTHKWDRFELIELIEEYKDYS